MWPFDKIEKKNTFAFGDVLAGLQRAISQAQEMLQNHQLENFSNFWNTDGKPVTHSLLIHDKTVDVPLFTLVPHSHLAMDNVTVEFSTRIGDVITKESSNLLKRGSLMHNGSESVFLSHADLKVAMDGIRSDGEDVMKVSITFKVRDTPEAVARLMDEYNKGI